MAPSTTVSALSLRALVHEAVLGERAFDGSRDPSFYESLGFDAARKFTLFIADSSISSSSNIDLVKFLCKTLWPSVVGKKIDKLQSNKDQTVFVLQDSGTFSDADAGWLSALAGDDSAAETKARSDLLSFLSGILRGALSAVGELVVPTIYFSVDFFFFGDSHVTGRDDAYVHFHQEHATAVSYTVTFEK